MKDENIYAEYLTKNKAKSLFRKVLLVVLLTTISFVGGFYLPKLMGKSHVKTVLKEEPKEVETIENKETKVEEKTEEKKIEKEEKKDDGKGPHFDDNGNPVANRSYELIDERSFDVTLNGIAYKIRSFYYKDDRKYHEGYILKELYFGTRKIVDLDSIGKYDESDPNVTLKAFIDHNYNLDKEMGKIIKDSMTRDEYFALYLYKNEVNEECAAIQNVGGNDSACEDEIKNIKGIVINKFGEVVFESKIEKYYLKLVNKKEVLDRTYYEDDDFYFVYDGDGDYYENQVDKIYDKYGITSPEFYRSGVEFKDNYFYYFEVVTKDGESVVYDYKGKFTNGVFKNELLNEYPANDNHVEGCSGQCVFK